MNSMTTKAFVLSIMLCALACSACKKKVEAPAANNATANNAKPSEVKTPEVKAPEVKEPEVKTPEVKEPEVKVDEAMFIKAYYEVTCAQAHINDIEKQKEVVAEILPRYGFDQAKFDAAKAKVSAQPNIKLALEAKMKSCTKEAALGFKTAGTTGEAVKAPVAKTKKPAAPSFIKSASQRGIKVGKDLQKGEIRLVFTKKLRVSGFFKGTREGKFFNISLLGTVQKNGSFSASGKQGTNNAKISGKVTKTNASGLLSGSINQKGFKVRINAK